MGGFKLSCGSKIDDHVQAVVNWFCEHRLCLESMWMLVYMLNVLMCQSLVYKYNWRRFVCTYSRVLIIQMVLFEGHMSHVSCSKIEIKSQYKFSKMQFK